MIDTDLPYPRTAAFLHWLLGDLTDDRVFRRGVIAGAVCGFGIGLVAVALLGPWALGVFFLLGLTGLGWLLRVLAAYGWGSPWRK